MNLRERTSANEPQRMKLSERNSANEPQRMKPAHETQPMKASVYLVDDHAVVRHGLRALLTDAGYPVLGDSGSFAEALADLPRLLPDVVVIDISLGERSGLELLAELQQRGLPMRSVVLTMSAQPRHVGNALRLGAFGYVLKGSPSEELLAAIDAVQSGRRHLGTEVVALAAQALAQGESQDPFAPLSQRERQVMLLVVTGRTSAEIGAMLNVSSKTIDSYRSRLMAKLDVPDVTALVRLAIRHDQIPNEVT